MKAKMLVYVLLAIILVISHIEAQQAGKVAPIGYLAVSSLSTLTQATEALRQGLRELGYGK